MKYCLLSTLLLSAPCLVLPATAAPSKEKEALQSLNEFIGSWKGNGSPSKGKPGPSDLWKETVTWGWKFKGDDIALTVTFADGKYFKSGELRYLAADKKYKLSVKDADDKELVFTGELTKDNILLLERKDEEKKISQRLSMNTAAEGDRFLYQTKTKKDGSTIWVADFEVGCTREGVTLGAKEKKIECVVSGGKGTIPVTYKGETFYVCCTGCRDAFNENPEKYIKEFKARKKE
jgi:YHS domain-containing protein